MRVNYVTILLIVVFLFALISFTSRMAEATPRKAKVQKQKERRKVLRERRLRRRAKSKRTLRKNFQVKRIKKRPKIHKNPKKPLTKRKKCNKVCQYNKLRLMMFLKAANDYRDSHFIEKGFKTKSTIKKRKKK